MLLIVPLSLALATPPVAPTKHRGGGPAIVQDGARRKRSGTDPMCCWCSVSSPAAFSWPSSPCICRPIWSIAASPRRPAVGSSPASGCSTSSARSASAGCRTAAQALHLVSDLFHPRDLRSSPSSRSRSRPFSAIAVRRGHRPDLALDGAADLGADGADVRHALVCDAVWICHSSATKSAAFSASGSAAWYSRGSGPTRRSGGCRCCSA